MTPALSDRVTQSEENTVWVHSRIDALTVSSLWTDGRLQRAAECWARVVDYYQAIVLLTRAGHYDSARALIRPLLEGYIRGMWLKIGATDHEVAVACQDRFPTFARMIETIQSTGQIRNGRLTELNAAWWGTGVHSDTHAVPAEWHIADAQGSTRTSARRDDRSSRLGRLDSDTGRAGLRHRGRGHQARSGSG